MASHEIPIFFHAAETDHLGSRQASDPCGGGLGVGTRWEDQRDPAPGRDLQVPLTGWRRKFSGRAAGRAKVSKQPGNSGEVRRFSRENARLREELRQANLGLESKKNGGLDGPALGNRIDVTVFLMGKVSQLAQMEGLNIRLACLKLDIFRAIYYS